MMHRRNHALGLVFSLLVGSATSIAAVACTHDFGAYESGGEGVTTSPEGSAEGSTVTGTDGSTTSSNDGAVTPPVDAATVDTGTDAGCAMAAACGATDTTCKSACDATLATCNQQCGSGGGSQNCKFKCKNDRDKCATNCTTTCRTCAGAGCGAVCN